jgi:hypothetical protein
MTLSFTAIIEVFQKMFSSVDGNARHGAGAICKVDMHIIVFLPKYYVWSVPVFFLHQD